MKKILTKIFVENYLNFILTVIAAVMIWNTLLLTEKLDWIKDEVLYVANQVSEVNATLWRNLGD